MARGKTRPRLIRRAQSGAVSMTSAGRQILRDSAAGLERRRKAARREAQLVHCQCGHDEPWGLLTPDERRRPKGRPPEQCSVCWLHQRWSRLPGYVRANVIQLAARCWRTLGLDYHGPAS